MIFQFILSAVNVATVQQFLESIVVNIIVLWTKIVAHLLSLVFQSFEINCPYAGLAITFLLDEKSNQKNQEENKLSNALLTFLTASALRLLHPKR